MPSRVKLTPAMQTATSHTPRAIAIAAVWTAVPTNRPWVQVCTELVSRKPYASAIRS